MQGRSNEALGFSPSCMTSRLMFDARSNSQHIYHVGHCICLTHHRPPYEAYHSTHSMAEILGPSSSDETKLWLQHIHAALEKQPARELFARFNRDTTVVVHHLFLCMHAPVLPENGTCRSIRQDVAASEGSKPRRCTSSIKLRSSCSASSAGAAAMPEARSISPSFTRRSAASTCTTGERLGWLT